MLTIRDPLYRRLRFPVRQWGKKFGKAFSDQLRQRTPARGDKWRMDEVVASIADEPH